MKAITILIVVVALITSCSRNDSSLFLNKTAAITTFTNKVTIPGKRIDLDVLGATDLYIIDTFFVFKTPKMEQFYSVYTINNYIECGCFVSKGQGPDEFPACFTPICKKEKEDLFLSFYNYMTSEVVELNLLESIKRQRTILSKPWKIENINSIYKIFLTDKNEYLVDYLDATDLTQHYAIWDKKNGLLKRDNIALNPIGISLDNSYLLATSCCYNEKKKIYATAMNFIDQINFYSIENPEKSFCISLNENKTTLKEIEKIEMPEKIEYHNDLRASDTYLFSLYSNQNRKDWALGNTPANIYIFDWSGNPILEIETKEKIIHFDIDKKQNKIYGITDKEELYSYDLSDLLDI